MTGVLALLGWVATAVAAFLLGIVVEHSEHHELDGDHRGSRSA